MRAQKEVRSTIEEVSIREYIYCYEQNGGRNMGVKSSAGKYSEGNEFVIENRRKVILVTWLQKFG